MSILFRPNNSQNIYEVESGRDIVELYKNQTISWRLFDFSRFRCEYDDKEDAYAIKARYFICGIEQEIVLGYTNKEVKF